jgi:hypothetical protein
MSVKTEGEHRQTPGQLFLCHFGTLVTASDEGYCFHRNPTYEPKSRGRSGFVFVANAMSHLLERAVLFVVKVAGQVTGEGGRFNELHPWLIADSTIWLAQQGQA